MSDEALYKQPSLTGGKIGPNSVIQLFAAIEMLEGEACACDIFRRAGFGHLINNMPSEMTDQEIPIALFDVLFRVLPQARARKIAEEAGRLTGDYVIANRIPAFAKWILRHAPRALGVRLLLKSIEKNAWTFAGSGSCSVTSKPAPMISIKDNPLTMPDCVWHAAVFETLFSRLLARKTVIRRTQCCAHGAAECIFEITFVS